MKKVKNELNKFDVALGDIMRQLRKAQKMSTSFVGEKIGITHQMVSLYELGKSAFTVTMLKKFCELYGVKYYDVIKQAGESIGDEI